MDINSKRFQREENGTELYDLETEIKELEKKLQEMEKKNNQMRDAEASSRLEMERLEKMVKARAERVNILSQKLETVMKDRVVPIVAAVVMKAMYTKAAEISQQDQNAGKQCDWLERIRTLQSRSRELSYENAEQVAEFEDMWSEVVAERNPAVHEVTGDDVVAILPHCEERLRHVLEQAFKSLWGISPGDWPSATPEQKGLVFRDCTDCELDRLG